MPVSRLVTASVFLYLLVFAAPASAAKTDAIVLVNGDRITCEVKTLSRGQLKVTTDDIGTLSVEWDKVVTVTTAGQFDIAMADGRRLVGRFGPAPAGQIGIGIVLADGTTMTPPFLDLVSFAPIRAGFFEKIDGSLDLGASYAQSSGIGQFSFSTNGAYRRPSFEASVSFASTLTQDADSSDSALYSLNIAFKRFHANRLVTTPFLLLEHNPDLGFDLRSTGAIALGQFIVQSNRTEVLLAGGVAIGRELPVGESATTNVDALIALSSSFYTYDYPKTTFDLSVLVFPGLSDLGRIRVNTNLKLKRELFRDFYIGLTGYDSFDNRPPGTDVSQNDIGFSLSLGWTF